MGFASYDDLISEMTVSGKFLRADVNKITGATTAYTAGRWYDWSALNGTPVANAWTGTALNWQTTTDTSGFGVWHGGNVTPDTKHLMNISALTGVATGVPGVLMLVDMQGYYPGISNNTTAAQTLVGTPSLRYANGAGVRAYVVQTAVAGATAQNIAMSYTNQAATAGRTLPVTVSATASAMAHHITHSGTAANNFGPFLPLASGDSGIQSVQTVTMSAANTGTCALVLARPLATIPITTLGVAGERDLVNQLPSMPQIKDGACLVWLYFAGAATATNTNFFMSADVAWG